MGKSTAAQSLAVQLGWRYRTTDKLARHPGRPWQDIPNAPPPHVAEHYLSLSTAELIVDVLRHYRENVWPLAASLITSHATDPTTDRLILEGSALLPELVVTLALPEVSSVWLTASEGFLRRRIYAASRRGTRSPREQLLIDKFLERSIRFDRYVMATVEQLRLASINVEVTSRTKDLANACLATLMQPGAGGS